MLYCVLTDAQLLCHETQLKEWIRQPVNHSSVWSLTYDHVMRLAVSLKEVREEIAKRHEEG